MAHVVLEDGDHTFDASAKTITLAAPYTTLSLGQIISIIDLKTNDVLYDSETQRKDAISISGAVITHTHGNTGQADADELQVTIDIGVFFLITDNNYSTTGALDFTTEKTVFEISDDTMYEILNPWIDITPFTNTATITFQFYRSVAVAGGTYRKAGDSITKVVGTDNPVVEFSDYAHYGYTKITAVSDNAGDSAVDVPFGYIKKPLE